MKIEQAKKRLIYSLLRLGLPLRTPRSAVNEPLMFDFLDDPNGSHEARNVMTGHDNGLITLAISEADDAIREKNRTRLGEPYRTLLGHFRHEVGHYYWDFLVRDQGRVDAFRELFGDETADYTRALEKYYATGAPAAWNDRFVSAYASSHPWEDFAETFAHYLHIVDTLDTARAVGLHSDKPGQGEIDLDFDPYRAVEMRKLVDLWIAVAFAANCLNRSMGQPDLYPFILSDPTIRKLGFVHALVTRVVAVKVNKPVPAAAIVWKAIRSTPIFSVAARRTKRFTMCANAQCCVALWVLMRPCPKRACAKELPMLTDAMLRRLLIAAAALSMSIFFAAEGFAMATTHPVAHSRPAPPMSGGWIYG